MSMYLYSINWEPLFAVSLNLARERVDLRQLFSMLDPNS